MTVCRQRGIGVLLALGLAVLPFMAAAQVGGLDWQVDGSSRGLSPTMRVRLVVENRLPPEFADASLGIVQVAAYLHATDSDVSRRLRAAAEEKGLHPEPSGHAGSGSGRVTVLVPGIDADSVGALVVMGRGVRLAGDPGQAPPREAAVRGDMADLEDRMQWGQETLIRSGQERVLWEGNVPVDTDALYADYIVVRASRRYAAPASGAEAAPDSMPEGGILAVSPTANAGDAPSLPIPRGTVLAQAGSGRVQPLALRRGALNVVRVIADLDVTASPVVRVSTAAESAGAPPE